MVDLKGAEEKLNQVDSLLTTLTGVLKKHWAVLFLLSLGAIGYMIWNQEDPVPTAPSADYSQEMTPAGIGSELPPTENIEQ